MFKHQDLQLYGLNLLQIYFHPLEVVGRGSEPQLQEGDFFTVAL